MTNKELNDRPSSFVTELKTLKGTNYKPNTLYEIIASIQHHLRTNGKFISLRDDADFSDLCVALDAKMKELSKLGLGINKKNRLSLSTEHNYRTRKHTLGKEYSWSTKKETQRFRSTFSVAHM